MSNELNSRLSFQAGFWDGLEDKEKSEDQWGFIETDFGSVPVRNLDAYRRGIVAGSDLRNLHSDIQGMIRDEIQHPF